jgi:hypothetical protein
MQNLNSFLIYRSLVGVDVNVAYSFVMRRRMLFCEIIRQILIAWAPVHVKLSLFHSVFYPIKMHIHGFCAILFYCAIDVMYPVAVVLSVSISVGGCLCPNSSKVVRRTAPSLAFMKTASISALAAEDITFLRTLLTIKIAQFVSFLSVFVGFCVAAHVEESPCPAVGFIF